MVPIFPRRIVTAAVRNDGAIAAALAFPCPSYALLDQTAAEVGIDEPSLGISHGLLQRRVGNRLTALASGKPLDLVDAPCPASSPWLTE
jgi:hypothetical protein